MYQFSDAALQAAWDEAIKSDGRDWRIRAELQTAKQTYSLGRADFESGAVQTEEQFLGENVIEIGRAPIFTLQCAIKDDGQYADVQFNAAVIRPEIGLMMEGWGLAWVPMGEYNITKAKRSKAKIFIEASNNMLKFERDFSDIPMSFPVTAQSLLSQICAKCGVLLDTPSFQNGTYTILSAPADKMSCRDIVYFISAIAGGWARCNRRGRLEIFTPKNPQFIVEANVDGNTDIVYGGDFTWWNNTMYDGGAFNTNMVDDTVTPHDTKGELNIDDYPIIVTGVTLDTAEETLLAGSSRYTAAMSENPLIQHDAPQILQSVFEIWRGFTFMPYEVNEFPNPQKEAGDLVELVDRNGKRYRTIIGLIRHTLRGLSYVTAEARAEAAAPFRAAQYKTDRSARERETAQVNAMDAAADNAFAMFAGTWGGYRINGDDLPQEKHHGNEYLADDPDINKATKIWAKNLGGIFYFENGINSPPLSAWTADGAFVAPIITANMIQTGSLQALNGSGFLDLNNGAFSFGNGALQWSAEGGFESISAQKITNSPTSRTWGEIGVLPLWGGISNIPAFQLTGPSDVYNMETSALRSFFMVIGADNGVFMSHGADGTMILTSYRNGTTTLLNSSGSAVELSSANGVTFEKNGQPYGVTGTFRSSDSKTITVTRGIITNIT